MRRDNGPDDTFEEPLDVREALLALRAAELDRREGWIRRAELACNAALDDELRAREAAIGEAERRVAEKRAELEAGERDGIERRRRLEAQLTDLAAARERVAAAQEEFESARSRLDRLEAQLEATQRTLLERTRLLVEREAEVDRRAGWLTARESLALDLSAPAA